MGYLHCFEQGLTLNSTNGVVRMKLALVHGPVKTSRFLVKPELVSPPPEGVNHRLILISWIPAAEVVVSLTMMF